MPKLARYCSNESAPRSTSESTPPGRPSGASSFNLVDTENAVKVDLFVVGDGLLDRMQIQRRVRIVVPGAPEGIWVTSPEDQVLRKLDWFRQSGTASDRQWRDVVGILRVYGSQLDREYLSDSARAINLSAELDEARRQADL